MIHYLCQFVLTFAFFHVSGVTVCGFLDLHIRKVIKLLSFGVSIIFTFVLVHYVIFVIRFMHLNFL